MRSLIIELVFEDRGGPARFGYDELGKEGTSLESIEAHPANQLRVVIVLAQMAEDQRRDPAVEVTTDKVGRHFV